MDIRYMVSQLVEHMMYENKNRGEIALYVNFDCGLSSYNSEKSYKDRLGLHLLYYLPDNYRSVSVFSGMTSSPFAHRNEVKNWKHEITHDSEWRNIGIFSKIYLDQANRNNEKRVVDGLKEAAPRDMHEHNMFGHNEKIFEWVPVRVEKDKSDETSYRRIITLL